MLHYISCLVVPYCIKKIIFTLIALRALYHSICDRCISPLLKQRCLANCHAISGRAIFRTNVTKKILYVRWKTFWTSTTQTSWTKWLCPSSRSPLDHHCHTNYCNSSTLLLEQFSHVKMVFKSDDDVWPRWGRVEKDSTKKGKIQEKNIFFIKTRLSKRHF